MAIRNEGGIQCVTSLHGVLIVMCSKIAWVWLQKAKTGFLDVVVWNCIGFVCA